MSTWILSGLIAAIPFLPWSKIWKMLLGWFDRTLPDARKDIEYKIKQAQVTWLTYETVILVFSISFGLLTFSWVTNVSSGWRYLLILVGVAPWYFLKWWGNQVKDVVRVELADFYRAFRQLLVAGAPPDEALEASIQHVKYLRKPLQQILENWGDPQGSRETLHGIFELYSDSDIKNLINLLETVLLNYQDETTLQTMESQEVLIRDLRDHAEETRDEAEKERLETLSTFIVLAQVFMIILPVVMDTIQQIRSIS